MPKPFHFGVKALLRVLLALFVFSVSSNLLLVSPTLVRAEDPTPPPGALGRLPETNGPSSFTPLPPVRSNLPPKMDLTAMLPPVGNQGGQGSCVAWATGYYYKSFQEKKKTNWPLNTTNHQFSPAFIYNQINGGHDNGTWPSIAFSLMIDKGADTLQDFPYRSSDYTTQPTAAQLANAANYKAANQYQLLLWPRTLASLDQLRQHLANGDLFVLGMPVYHEFDHAQNNIDYVVTHSISSTETPRGYHEVTAVGYDDARQAFRIVNQWGSGWGNGGFTWLSYSFIRDFALDATALVNRNQLDFSTYPSSTPSSPDSALLAFNTSRPTTVTVNLDGTVVKTTSSLTSNYSLNISGLTAITSTAVVTITDATGEFTSATLLVPPSSVKVTVPTDTGNVSADGSLSKALSTTANGQFIVVALPGGQHTIQVNGALPALNAGVQLLGSADCTSPMLIIDGGNIANIGLTLKGNNTLMGVMVKRFKQKQLVIQGLNNRFECSGASTSG